MILQERRKAVVGDHVAYENAIGEHNGLSINACKEESAMPFPSKDPGKSARVYRARGARRRKRIGIKNAILNNDPEEGIV